uniref:Uncharacterized protein n=1 Tax=Vitis vinifera TaxID=29760 RepID=A5ADR9_VITVI|nr:hypothetical protein VITISV_010875 [Vitis vinifera]
MGVPVKRYMLKLLCDEEMPMEGPPSRVPFQLRYSGRLGQVCNPSGSFHPDQDKFRLAPEVRGFLSPTRPNGIGSSDSQTGRIVPSSLKDLWHA